MPLVVDRRKALTLVELLVVIAIVGVLLALLLPAVQMAREASRRASCASHLRQVILAIHTYHDVHTFLPVSCGPFPPPQHPSAVLNGKGWIAGILPFVEESGLEASLAKGYGGDFSLGTGINAPPCSTAMATALAILKCPSDGTADSTSLDEYQWIGKPVALTNYKGVMGDSQIGGLASQHPGTLPDCHAVGTCNGLFFRTTIFEPQSLRFRYPVIRSVNASNAALAA